jgi:hypothetical protein
MVDNELTEKEKKELLKKSEISLILEGYNDIFSDFDPRSYTQRALSDDFLIEAKKASRDKISGIGLTLLIPRKNRKITDEIKIKRRIKEHFKNHYEQLHKQIQTTKRRGWKFVISGVITMFLASIAMFYESSRTIWSSFLITLLEPAGWFLFWEGLDLVIFDSKKSSPDYEFYKKMTKCEISFKEY